MIIKRLLFLIACSLCASCFQNNLQRDMEDFLGSKVVLPESDDSENDDIKFRLVIWFDSLDCQTCRLKLLNEIGENPVMKYAEKSKGTFGIQLILSPKKRESETLKRIVDTFEFSFPVWLDKNAEFLKNNPQLPHDMRLQTFLLDKNGMVILVGDPMYNPKLWELYKKTITQLQKTQDRHM